MKTFSFQNYFWPSPAIVLVSSTLAVAVENSPASNAPALSYGVPQILQLAQAKLADDTIVAYIRDSRNSYDLNADQIIYLKQQGISENVINRHVESTPAGGNTRACPTRRANSGHLRAARTGLRPVRSSSSVYVMPTTRFITAAGIRLITRIIRIMRDVIRITGIPGAAAITAEVITGAVIAAAITMAITAVIVYSNGYHGSNYGYAGGGGYHGGVTYAVAVRVSWGSGLCRWRCELSWRRFCQGWRKLSWRGGFWWWIPRRRHDAPLI